MGIDKVYLNCDGGSRGNPGPAAIGVVIWDENHNKLYEYKECIGTTTNNVAEYKALIKGLELSAAYTRNEVHVFMDSELVIKQTTGLYRIKKSHLHVLVKRYANPYPL